MVLAPEAVVLPSFHDSHAHPAAGGLQAIQCNLRGCRGLAEALERIEAYAASLPPGDEGWLMGGGWQAEWFEGLSPTAALLDGVCATRPAYLRDVNGHELWTNSLGLAAAGISRDTADPPNGQIKRDARGEPSGHLLEEATRLVAQVLPPITDELADRGLNYAVEELVKSGITSVHDAAVSPSVFATYLRALRAGRLGVTVHLALQWRAALSVEDNMRHLLGRREECRSVGTELLAAETVKIFLDGIPENCTAAMHAPYHRVPHRDDESWAGVLNYTPERLTCIVAALCSANFQVHVHCLGDAAITTALDAFETLPKAVRLRCRNIVAHCQFVSPSDLRRFRHLDVLVNLSPFWFQELGAETAGSNVGMPRALNQYPALSILEAGASLCFGSDWPVSSLVPLEGIQVAVTRLPLQPYHIPFIDSLQWNFHEAISLGQAFAAYTHGSATANFREHEVGTIKPGFLADLIVLDRDPFLVSLDEISRCNVIQTFSRGQLLFSNQSRL